MKKKKEKKIKISRKGSPSCALNSTAQYINDIFPRQCDLGTETPGDSEELMPSKRLIWGTPENSFWGSEMEFGAALPWWMKEKPKCWSPP